MTQVKIQNQNPFTMKSMKAMKISICQGQIDKKNSFYEIFVPSW